MKHRNLQFLCLSLLLSAMAMPSFSQVVSNDNEDEVNKVDQRFGQDYVPGQVLVKMKDSSPANVRRVKGKFKSTGISKLDAVLQEFGVGEMEKLMPNEKPGRKLRKAKAFNGSVVQERDLSQLYLLQMNEEKAVETHQLVERLAELPEVEFAEPNYKAYIMADVDDYAAEPLYDQQWGLSAINLPQLWGAEKISQKRPVIAILDTGIDITHPDLANNIWTNRAEAEGEEGYDNDNNGFKNDVHGWDFINQTGNIRDFNGHGTHCAGIAAAIGNNHIGVTGANPDALIMPITIMQSDGTGDLATIIKGIDYAVAMGADVLSMSIGTYATSAAFKEALGKAYQTAILVAAAGNDGLCLNHAHPERGQLYPKPMFPAAYNFVLGVQASATSGAMAGFSNFDDDGAFFSAYGEEELYNYELRAPGASILSLWPGGNYRTLNGTSMACPLVAGALSRLIQCKDIDNKEVLFGDLIHSNTLAGDLDIYKAYQMDEENRRPNLSFVTFTIDDSEGDSDGYPDAGETIAIYPTIRNGWGLANNIRISIELGELEDPDIVEFLNNNVTFGFDLSGYAKNTAATPLRLKISETCADNRHIKLVLKATCDGIENADACAFSIIVTNMTKIGGLIAEDMILTADKNWLVTSNLAIPEGVKLTIEPGTIVEFETNIGLSSVGTMDVHGTPEKPIIFKSHSSGKRWGKINIGASELSYCIISDLDHITASNCNNCIFTNSLFDYTYSKFKFDKCNILNSRLGFTYRSSDGFYTQNCNYVNNMGGGNMSIGLPRGTAFCDNIINSTVYESYALYSNCAEPIIISYNQYPYLGTSKENIARNYIADILSGSGFGKFDLSNMPDLPYAEAHGIVWKVVVNGYDAQDEFEQLPPLGVGRHKFEVYFNRPMNKEVAPQISFGVREPYTQQVVAEDGSWNEEGTIYTAYKTITGKTKSDGLNRIYVYGAEDDEFFEIPYENTRFNINIQAAGSMATGFAAEAGLGRVNLTWNNENNDFEDAMGFNVYRYKYVEKDSLDSWGNSTGVKIIVPDTIRINQDIVDIEATSYTDYDVKPGETYYYYYKVLSTDLQEYDVSNVVAVTPLTGEQGDANGSGDVDVADVITTVNYAAGQQPKPFIFEAADMNADLSIDILDVIGIIKVILHPESAVKAAVNSTATYTIENGTLYVDSPVALAGVQVQLAVDEGQEITVADDLKGFEHTSAWFSDNDYFFMAYSMAGKKLEAGRHALLHLGSGKISKIRLSDADGHNVEATGDQATRVNRMATDVMTVKGIYDLQGRKLTGDSSREVQLPKGVYIINGKKVVR